MFLKALTLKGFKSFADTTVLHLEPGVTVVVGPNGSGKSNVVDAIAWVLGAQAPSSVRSQKMDDVIFAGTVKRPALGRAEVVLTLDNSAGLLPIEFNEVSISRTLFRSGESEYAINGVGCRLLDVHELLGDAGVGRQQHVIVSQGQIDAVLNSRPEDRRAIIEEAAGVLKFRRRKDKAERRLDSTEASLLRVQDLLREVRRQLRPLERQAEAARRHGGLIAELRGLEIFLAGRSIATMRTTIAALAEDSTLNGELESSLLADLGRLEGELVAAQAEMIVSGETSDSDELVRVEQLHERARGLIAVLAERRRSMERNHGQLMDAGVVANLEHDAVHFAAELVVVEGELAGVAPLADALAADEESFATERERVSELLDAAPDGSPAASAAAEVRGEMRSLRAAIERGEAEVLRQVCRLDDLRQRILGLESEILRLKSECEQSRAIEEPLVAEVRIAEDRRIRAEGSVEAGVAAHQAAAEALSRWRTRSDALQLALDSARARAGSEKLANLEGVVGTMLELVEIDPGWEAAVEAAMGEALLAVVVRDPDAARSALSSLRSSKTAGAVIALGVSSAADASRRGGIHTDRVTDEPVRAHVRAHAHGNEAEIEALLDALVGGAVRVADWSTAIDGAIADPTATIVTDDGDRFGRAGWRLGAAGGGATAAALEEAIERATQAAGEFERCDVALRDARVELSLAARTETELTHRLDANDSRFIAASEALGRAQGDRREATAEIATVTRAVNETGQRLDPERNRLADLEALFPVLEADERAEAAAARGRAEARTLIDDRHAALSASRQDLEVRNAGLQERRQLLQHRIDETHRRLDADRVAHAEAAERRIAIERSLGAVASLSRLVDTHRQAIERYLVELHDRRRRRSEEVRMVVARFEQARLARSAVEEQLDASRARSHRIELDAAETRVRLEAAVEALERDLGVSAAEAEATLEPSLPAGVTAPVRLRDLERELRLLGPINPLALDEFNELQARLRFLEQQLEDVRDTRRELSRVIRAVDAEIQSIFATAFADVSVNFTDLFAKLFPGGAGRLVLTDPTDLLNTGIEVEARPSGKNIKKLSLLSGGERSLTALAYLFAVFRSRPSPFYVMDEVEAALDDVNLHRFLNLIAEFRRDAQLLIVSHQKRTMEAGDSLLGVSMQPGGSSKLVTERQTATV